MVDSDTLGLDANVQSQLKSILGKREDGTTRYYEWYDVSLDESRTILNFIL